LAKLIVKQGGQSREVPLQKETVSIGRTPENDIELKDSLISRRHTSIVRKGDRWMVYDLGSSNGTYVNRERIESKTLENGDVVRVGDTEITYLDEGRPSKASGGAPVRLEDLKGTQEYAAPPSPFGPQEQIVRKVDEIAQSYSINIQNALSQGLSLREIRPEVGGERAAKDSKMFFILFQVGKALSSAESLDHMLQTATRLVAEVANAERIVVLLRDGQGELMPRLTFQKGKGFVGNKEVSFSRTIANQVVREKVSVVTSDALADDRFKQGLSIVQHNIRSALCVPLWEESKVYGAMYLDNLAKSYAFTKDDLELMTAIANLIAIRVKQEETSARLRREETLRANLSKYHSPDHVKLLMERGGDVGLEVSDREVTVVFVDVVGSTSMAEARTPAEVAGVLNEFFLMCTNAIFAHEGHVNNFIGDEVMGIFNAPLDMKDHAVQAVKACAAFLKELKRWNEVNPGKKFDVRCAINSGHVVAGNVGTPSHLKYTVLGDAVNVAARLSKFPQVNSIVVGERTFELVKHAFKGKDLGEVVLKGKEKPSRAYEIQT
jgi:adenylate cyclase